MQNLEIDPISLTQDFIRAASVTPDQGAGVRVAKSILEKIGFTCVDLIFGEGDAQTHNLYAKIGSGAPHFCFAGHTDVVHSGNEAAWRFPPFAAEIAEGRLYGRGAEDMKAAIAAFICAASRFGAPAKGTISLLLTGDEEGSGTHGTQEMLQWLTKKGEKLDACIVGEPTNPQTIGEMVKIGRRGSVNVEIIVHGKQGHVAYPHLADNPANKLVTMLHALKTHLLDEGNIFFPPSNLEITMIDVSNPSVNVIPAHAKARLNIRFNDLHHSGNLIEWIKNACQDIHSETEVLSRVSGEAFLTPPGELSETLLRAVHKITGRLPELSTMGGTSDARFIKDYCPVVEFGATGRTPHMVNEYIEIQDIFLLSDIYHQFLIEYFR